MALALHMLYTIYDPMKIYITIYFHIWTQYKYRMGIIKACRGISIEISVNRRQPGMFMVHRHLISPSELGYL